MNSEIMYQTIRSMYLTSAIPLTNACWNFQKDLASMFLMIKYQKDFKTLQSVPQSIPELDTVEQETFDTAWNFLDKRMLKFKDKAQNAKGEGEYVCCR